MNPEYLKQLNQLVQNQPVTLLEFKELLLRHLLSDPDNHQHRAISSHLLETYMIMMESTAGYDVKQLLDNDTNLDRPRRQIVNFFQSNFNLGYLFGRKESGDDDVACPKCWPNNLPFDMGYYPTEVIKQFAALMGYQRAKRAA